MSESPPPPLTPCQRPRWWRQKGRVGLILLVLSLLGYYALPWSCSLPPRLHSAPVASVWVTDGQGMPLRNLPVESSYRCQPMTYEEIPPTFMHCLLAAEDSRFWDHGGVDFLALGRVFRDAASTKVHEALLARQLEMIWSKERILTEYVNRVDFGHRSRGLAAAATACLQLA